MWIRPASGSDLLSIARIQAASPEGAHWPPSDYLLYDFIVAGQAGSIDGYLVSRSLIEEREILSVAVDPAARRRGIATALLNYELRRPAAAWFLEVRVSNTAARELYRRAGFEEVGVRSDYYDQPREDGIVMRKLS